MKIAALATRACIVSATSAAILIVSATAALAGDNNGNGQVDFGDTGPAVRCVQEIVSWEAIPVGPIDGIFGDKTRSGVRVYQDSYDLSVDGQVGPQTGGHMSRHALDLQREAQSGGETSIAQKYANWRARCDSILPG